MPSPAEPPGEAGSAWSGLYADGPPAETGVGAATLRRKRHRRRRLLAAGLATLAVLGAVAYVVTPRWWWSRDAYVEHLGYGPYDGVMPAELRRLLSETVPGLVAFVERERNLRFAADPAVVFLPDDRFRAEFASHTAFERRHHLAPATFGALGWAYRASGSGQPAAASTGREVVSLYGEWDGRIYLRGRELTPLARLELVGLLTRALDDQTFNLGALYGPRAERDERAALDALVAGDSRSVQQAYLRQRPVAERCRLQLAVRLPLDPACGRARPAAPADPTAALQAFADDYGLRFVTGLRAAGGTAALDAAFRRPPRSTADVMSLPHYRLDRAFRVVDYPRHTGRLLDFGTLGAYPLSLLLAGGDPERVDTGHAVSGWRGDSYSTHRPRPGQLCVTDSAVFDTPAQASHFAARMRAVADAVRQGPADAVTTRFCRPTG